MPLYEYKCGKCGMQFEELVSSSSVENPVCPGCGEGKTEKLLSIFAASVGGASAGSAPPCGMKGSGCGGGFT